MAVADRRITWHQAGSQLIPMTKQDPLRFTGAYIVTTAEEQLLIQTISDGTVRVAKRKDATDTWQAPVWGKQVPHE